MSPSVSPPQKLSFDISIYPKLDAFQAGHLRHFSNLVSQPDGEWHHFGSQDPGQEWDDAYRYQLATMAYATSVAHYHRLPALRGVFQPLFRRMIHKMLRREVWGYWFNQSHGGKVLDPDLKELRKPWADPVVHENIMYSGHLLLMTSLYAMLFDDSEFEKKGSIIFDWNPLFWGLGQEQFTYDNRSLQQVILAEMERNGWIGVCCEPNAVFVVCNQFPIIAMRYNDVRDGTDIVEGVLERYQKALTAKAMIGTDGLYARFYAVKQDRSVPATQAAHTAWANAYMNTWNSSLVHSLYEQQTLGHLTKFDGKTQLQHGGVASAFRRLVLKEGASPYSKQTLIKSREIFRADESARVIPYQSISWGSFMQMLSELGKTQELDDLLEYADTHLSPTWEKGGLYYPREDRVFDVDERVIHMEPHSGNSGIGYARLNVENGQKQMWENPWTHETLMLRPWIDDIVLGDGVDFLRGTWDETKNALVVTVEGWEERKPQRIGMKARNLSTGTWAVYVRGELTEIHRLEAQGDIRLELDGVGIQEVDVVVLKI